MKKILLLSVFMGMSLATFAQWAVSGEYSLASVSKLYGDYGIRVHGKYGIQPSTSYNYLYAINEYGLNSSVNVNYSFE
jgi:hypothetical protein